MWESRWQIYELITCYGQKIFLWIPVSPFFRITHSTKMLLSPTLLILLFLLQLIAGSPTSNAQASRSRRRGWENDVLVQNATDYDDPLEYYYEDELGQFDSSQNWKRDDYDHKLRRWSDGTVIRQTTRRPEMKFLSQAMGVNLDSLVDLAYLNNAGSGATVYIHDSGLYKEHPEFTDTLPDGVTRGHIRIIQPKKTASGETIPIVHGDPDGHGTCMADKVIGTHLGIAKGANLVMVPMADFENDDYMLAELQQMVDDMKEQKVLDQGFWAAVILPYDLGLDGDLDTMDKYRKKYLAMVDEGALLVASAGNEGSKPTNNWPALFIEEDAFKNNMIVVGSVDVSGKVAPSSQRGPLVGIYAPGEVATTGNTEGIVCAANFGRRFAQSYGTSLSVPQVAGLAAYLYSIDPSLRGDGATKKIIDKITHEASYKRPRCHKRSIWNLEYGTAC